MHTYSICSVPEMTRNQDASRDEKENEIEGETLTRIVLYLSYSILIVSSILPIDTPLSIFVDHSTLYIIHHIHIRQARRSTDTWHIGTPDRRDFHSKPTQQVFIYDRSYTTPTRYCERYGSPYNALETR